MPAEATATRPPGRAPMTLVLVPVVMIVLVSVALSFVLVRRHVSQIQAGLIDRARTIAQFMSRDSVVGILSYDHATVRHLVSLAAIQEGILYVALHGEGGREIARRGAASPEPARLGAARVLGHGGMSLLPFDGGWEVRAPLHASALEARLEGDEPVESALRPGTKKLVGQIRIGISREGLERERRMAVTTAVAFTVTVALFAIAGAVVLMRRHLATLLASAALAAEHERVARLKARIVTQTSHEFRTPLAVIVGASDVLQRYGDRLTTEERTARLEKIRAAVRQMTALLDDVLMFGRTDADRFTPMPTDLVELCRTAVEQARTSLPANLQLVTVLPAAPVEAVVDPFLLGQVLRNLLANAVKFSPDGGTITLRLDAGAPGPTIAVCDEGIGIPAGDLPHLFEPFQRGGNTGRFPGVGLGLAIAKRAIDVHGGRIAATSVEGVGTTVTLTVPAPAPARSAAA